MRPALVGLRSPETGVDKGSYIRAAGKAVPKEVAVGLAVLIIVVVVANPVVVVIAMFLCCRRHRRLYL